MNKLIKISVISCFFLTLVISGCSGKRGPSDASKDASKAKDAQAMQEQNVGSEQGSQAGAAGSTSTKDLGAAGLLERIYFDFDDANLRADARDTLKKDAEILKQNPSLAITIEGHCDDRGSAEYNLALGEKRAENVKRYLANLGISAQRLNVISYGEEKPLVQGENEEAWSKNRRGDFSAAGTK
jgi:peptidoglycan-associated lipoprotein